MTCAHHWGPPQHFLRCADGTLADLHIRICGVCYDVIPAGPCICTAAERQRAAEQQRVLDFPLQRWAVV